MANYMYIQLWHVWHEHWTMSALCWDNSKWESSSGTNCNWINSKNEVNICQWTLKSGHREVLCSCALNSKRALGTFLCILDAFSVSQGIQFLSDCNNDGVGGRKGNSMIELGLGCYYCTLPDHYNDDIAGKGLGVSAVVGHTLPLEKVLQDTSFTSLCWVQGKGHSPSPPITHSLNMIDN